MFTNVFWVIPNEYPRKSTIWNFREKLTKTGIMGEVWKIFKQFSTEGKYYPGKKVRQDASFYTTDKGQKKKDYPRGKEAKTRRSREGE
jgi:IS5 family transposase